MSFIIPRTIAEMNPRIVPIRNGKKCPSIKQWTETSHRVSDLVDDVNLEFVDDDHDAYGIVIDDHIIVVDVDVHEGGEDGYASLGMIADDGGPDLLSEAKLIVETPSGGLHLYFTKSESLKIKKTCSAYPAIDMLQTGCQVIGPNSRGGAYKIKKDGIPSLIPRYIEDFWGRPAPRLVDYGQNDYANDQYQDSPIDDFNRSGRGFDCLIQELRARGYSVRQSAAMKATFTRPNKTDMSFSISGTIGSLSKNGNLLLRNFSTSDPTFPSEESVTIAHAFGLLTGCDKGALPKKLRENGFGSSKVNPDSLREIIDAFKSGGKRERRLTGEEIEASFPTIGFDDLVAENNGERREYIIDGLLRSGEVMNVIAAPKMGKSYLVYNLALALSTGGQWMGFKSGRNDLKILIADNELHREELAHRVKAVASAMGIKCNKNLHFTCLRGSDIDVNGLDSKLDEIGGSRFDIIVIDALYRILPAGASENDNAAMTQLYNRLDAIASKCDAAVICVHHTSKGAQSDKSVTDVGAGAGSISRAADTHLVIRPHAEDGHCVIDAVTRSGKSPETVTGVFEYPLWSVSDIKPELKSFEAGRSQVNDKRKMETLENLRMMGEIAKEHSPISCQSLQDRVKLFISSRTTFQKYKKNLVESGEFQEVIIGNVRHLQWVSGTNAEKAPERPQNRS